MTEYKDLNDYEVMYLVEEGNDDARDIILEKYKPIIKGMASKYFKSFKRYGIEYEDLVQEGYLGLYNAIRGYHSAKNTLFYTYATISIRSKMLNYLKRYTNQKNLANVDCTSLDQIISKDNDEPFFSLIEDRNVILPDDMLDYMEFESKINNFIYSLDFPYSLVFELKINGFGNKDISILLDCPLKKVTNCISKIRRECNYYLGH